MILTQKETTLLKDIKKQEQLCVDKYLKCEEEAYDPQLKSLFGAIADNEKNHLETITKILDGTVPSLKSDSTSDQVPDSFDKVYSSTMDKDEMEHDKYLCSDTLATEKHVATVYNTSIFECADENVRQALNHIQAEEQHHGKVLYDYMSTNGMYQ